MRPPVDWEPTVHRAASLSCPLSGAGESPTCPPDRPSKILLVQVGTLSSSHPSFGVTVFFLFFGKVNPSSLSHPSLGCFLSFFFEFIDTNYRLLFFHALVSTAASQTRPRAAGARRSAPSTSTGCTPPTSRPSSTKEGIAIRSGHHCTQPLHAELVWRGRSAYDGSARASLYIYNTHARARRCGHPLRGARVDDRALPEHGVG